MKEIKIITLDIENFKGIRSLKLQLHGRSTALYGDNATGKSSVYDALTWLLFGKDSRGNTKFSIKPLDADGNTTPGVMPTVSTTLNVNGSIVSLRKILREKWEKHRGGQERYAGNTVDYFVDDVPMKERDYKAYITELVPEDIFRALTSTYHFCRDISWKERRTILFDLACVESDAQLLKSPQFDALRAEIGNRTVEDFRAMLAQKRKDMNSKLNLLPARIDECEKQASDLPATFDPTQQTVLSAKIADLRGQLAALDNSEARNAKRNEIRAAELELQAVKAENDQHRRSQDIPVVNRRDEIQRAIYRLESTRRRTVAEAEQRRKSIADADEQLNEYRARWKATNAEQYTGGTCPTCGQTLPEDMEEAARRNFDARKKKSLAQLVSDSDYIKQRQNADKESLTGLRKAVGDIDAELNALRHELETAEAPQEIAIEDLPDYMERCVKIEEYIADLRTELEAWDNYAGEERSRLRDEMHRVEQEKAAQDAIAANVKMRESLETRISELEQERQAKAAYIEHIDELVDMCEDFTQYKVERVSAAVNGRFHLVSFRLFTEAINGSLSDCCDPLVDGVPYSDLNSAMQINAGLDCIHTLSEFYGVSVPLFVDNAESVTRLYNLETQVIRLVVSEEDKELRCIV
ncbi:MAG: AAA family ATPase [Clostridia bacterium]|nr:AAA family ATPase [Clostridia bacterium]